MKIFGSAVPVLLLLVAPAVMNAENHKRGEKLFKAYCWGCHHQTAEAFGPSFKTIANKRDRSEIIAQIADPDHTYRQLGYTRNSMPAFDDLNASQLEALTDYIMQFKDKK
ncbi:c-type cytochrome [Hydrogenimonas urashimensis]|uniref:c-type cytochrome n=1 Tax=Hydrogenimonas urashimensis TaxID=2740515 RepID=UPI001F1D0E0E|nr:cytochrome c [Hydrogenimonas urashimensis]